MNMRFSVFLLVHEFFIFTPPFFCGTAEATGLGLFCCYPNRVNFGFINFPILHPKVPTNGDAPLFTCPFCQVKSPVCYSIFVRFFVFFHMLANSVGAGE